MPARQIAAAAKRLTAADIQMRWLRHLKREGVSTEYATHLVEAKEVPLLVIEVPPMTKGERKAEKIATYVRLARTGRLPPITLRPFLDEDNIPLRNRYFPVDGFHRLEAYRVLGRKTIPAAIVNTFENPFQDRFRKPGQGP